MARRRKVTPKEKPDTPSRAAVSGEHKGKPAFILCADDHVRNGAPECRTDDYVEAIFKKLEFRYETAAKLGIQHILQAGDVGDKNYFVKEGKGWTAGVFGRFIYQRESYPNIQTHCVAGNHDLPGHDIENLMSSALGSLVESGVIKLLGEEKEINQGMLVHGCSWGEEPPKPLFEEGGLYKNILVIHKMIINGLPLWPGQEAPKAKEILKKYPEFDLIVSGDNHNTFVSEHENRILVNPGSMMRTTTSQFNHEPCFFLYYPESHTVEKVLYNFDCPENVISRVHVEKKKIRTERMGKYSHAVETADFSDLKSFPDNVNILMEEAGVTVRIRSVTERFLNHEQPLQE